MLRKFLNCTIERHGQYLIYKDQQGRELGMVRMYELPPEEIKLLREANADERTRERIAAI